MTFDDEAKEAAAKKAFWSMNSIMHDHEKLWNSSPAKEAWRSTISDALDAAIASASIKRRDEK